MSYDGNLTTVRGFIVGALVIALIMGATLYATLKTTGVLDATT